MRRGADNLHALVPCLVVGLRTLECGQEPVVDVDDAVLEFLGEGFTQDLHVAGEDDRVGAGFGDDFAETVLGNALVGVAGDVVEGHAEGAAHGAQVGVVADDAAEFAGEVAVAPLEQEVVQAVVRLRYENSHAFRLGGIKKFPVQLKVRRERLEVLVDFADVARFKFKNSTEEKSLDVLGRMLLEVDDVCSSLREHLGRAGDKPFLVGTVNLQYITSCCHA